MTYAKLLKMVILKDTKCFLTRQKKQLTYTIKRQLLAQASLPELNEYRLTAYSIVVLHAKRLCLHYRYEMKLLSEHLQVRLLVTWP